MKLTLDVRISGCTARCWHCYVDGQPGPLMPLDEYRRSLDALRVVCDELAPQGFSISLWLDYEPLLHPQIAEILSLTKERFGDLFDVSIFPTAGLPLATRPDWEEVLEALRRAGCEQLMFTLHGPPSVQDVAMGRPGASERQSVALSRARSQGFRRSVKLIVSKETLEHFDETMETADRHSYDAKRAVVPIYEPISRLREFELHRPTIEDAEPFLDRLAGFCDGSDERDYWLQADEYAERSLLRQLLDHPEDYPSFAALEAQLPAWVFVTVVPGLTMYYGNAGLYHRKLGQVSEDSAPDLAEQICALPSNYQFGGRYDVGSLPGPVEVARQFGDPKSGKLYSSTEDACSRWLDLMSVGP